MFENKNSYTEIFYQKCENNFIVFLILYVTEHKYMLIAYVDTVYTLLEIIQVSYSDC